MIPAADLVRPKRAKRKSPRQSGAPRKATIAIKKLTRAVLAAEWIEQGGQDDELPSKPRTWGECTHARPCVFVSCRHHLYLDVSPETGAITINRPDVDPHEMKHSCSLDIARDGAHTLEEVGEFMNLTRERIRQLEVRVMIRTLKPRVRSFGIDAPIG